MVDLQQYEEYFRELSQALPGIGSMLPVTYDIDIYEYVQSLRAEDLPVLFVVLPTCESLSRDPDCVVERNFGMCLLLDKTDWQRERGLDAQKRLQPTFEEIKSMMRQEYGRCGIFSWLNLEEMTSSPESGLFKELSGWSLGFTFDSI